MVTNSKPTHDKPQSLKKEFLIFISIPVTMIILVAGLLYIPSALAKPKYGFMYAYCPDYYCDNSFSTDANGKVTEKLDTSTDYYNPSREHAELYIHDVMTNSSKKIDLSTAQNFKLDTANVSPDGYTLKWIDSSSGFFFVGSSSNAHWYLKNGMKKKQMNLESDTYNSQSVNMLGWIE